MESFWKDDNIAHRDNCFYEGAPQIALGIRMSEECVFAELGEDGDPWGREPDKRRLELNRRYNEKARKIVGRALLRETMPEKDSHFPEIRRIGHVFGGTYESGYKTGEWLHSPVKTPEALEAMLDRVDKLDLHDFLFPPNWESEKKRIYETYGMRPGLVHHVRGPVTLAMSIYGNENLIYLYYDAPELYRRFSASIKKVILEIARFTDAEAGYTEDNRPRGFSFADDDCNLLTPEMYADFGYPVLRDVFAYYSPDPADNRYQHSDSAMGHLLPLLADFNLTGCNFGPTVLTDAIRKHMPATRIDGCLAPFTFMRNDREALAAEVLRDINMVRESGVKGMDMRTAGSINNGSSLENMRLVMQLIQNYGRF